MHRYQREHGQPRSGRERRGQVRHPGDVPVGLAGHALQQRGQQHAPAQRGERAADHHEPVPAGADPFVGRPAAQLHPGGDQDDPDQRTGHGRIAAGEQFALQHRESAEQDAHGGDQPDLVAEEERAERGERGPRPARAAAAREQQPDAVVVAGEHQVAGEEEAEQGVPGEVHR